MFKFLKSGEKVFYIYVRQSETGLVTEMSPKVYGLQKFHVRQVVSFLKEIIKGLEEAYELRGEEDGRIKKTGP